MRVPRGCSTTSAAKGSRCRSRTVATRRWGRRRSSSPAGWEDVGLAPSARAPSTHHSLRPVSGLTTVPIVSMHCSRTRPCSSLCTQAPHAGLDAEVRGRVACMMAPTTSATASPGDASALAGACALPCGVDCLLLEIRFASACVLCIALSLASDRLRAETGRVCAYGMTLVRTSLLTALCQPGLRHQPSQEPGVCVVSGVCSYSLLCGPGLQRGNVVGVHSGLAVS